MAFFQSSGTLPCFNEAENIRTSASTTSLQHSLSILVDIPSGPLALVGSSCFKSFNMPFFVNVMVSIVGASESFTSGVVPSSVEKTLAYWLFKISAMSLSLVWMVPSSSKGLTPIMSDFLDFTNEKKRLLFLSSSSMTFSLIKLLYACVHVFLAFLAASLYLSQSLSRRVRLYTRYLLSFFLTDLLQSLLNQGWLYRVEVIFVGTCLLWDLRRMSLKRNHRWFIGESVVSDVISSDIPSLTSFFRVSKSALFQMLTFRRMGLIFWGWQRMSATIAVSWSPKPDVGSMFFISPGRLVRRRSRVAFLRVVNSTIWVSLTESKISRNSSFNFFEYWWPMMFFDDQSMSGRLKSPPNHIGIFLCFWYIWRRPSMSSWLAWDELFGDL